MKTFVIVDKDDYWCLAIAPDLDTATARAEEALGVRAYNAQGVDDGHLLARQSHHKFKGVCRQPPPAQAVVILKISAECGDADPKEFAKAMVNNIRSWVPSLTIVITDAYKEQP